MGTSSMTKASKPTPKQNHPDQLDLIDYINAKEAEDKPKRVKPPKLNGWELGRSLQIKAEKRGRDQVIAVVNRIIDREIVRVEQIMRDFKKPKVSLFSVAEEYDLIRNEIVSESTNTTKEN